MDFIDACRSYLGVPFRHQGRNRLGLDCGGLLIAAAADIGITLEDVEGYRRTPDGKTLQALMERALTRVNREPVDGDVLLMKLRKYPQHIAIKTDIGIIHAHADNGKVVEHRMDDNWRKAIVGVYQLG